MVSEKQRVGGVHSTWEELGLKQRRDVSFTVTKQRANKQKAKQIKRGTQVWFQSKTLGKLGDREMRGILCLGMFCRQKLMCYSFKGLPIYSQCSGSGWVLIPDISTPPQDSLHRSLAL